MTAPATTKAPEIKLVTLSMGALTHLNNIFSSQKWTSSAKEKHAAGKLQVKLEDLLFAGPDAPKIGPNNPEYAAQMTAFNIAERKWRNTSTSLELSSLAYQACTSAVKFFVNQEGGSDRYLSELQEAFLVTE